MELPAEITWDESVRQRINDAVLAEVGKVRICQKVFPTRLLSDKPTEIPFDVLDLPKIEIREGQTRPFVELYLEFPLTATQVQKEPERRFCETLARMATKAIALAEDMIIFQGQNGQLPANVTADQRGSALDGLLGAADPANADDKDANRVSVPIDVLLAQGARPGVLWGENTFTAVADGISKLVTKGQAPEYALFLPTKVYADTFAPPGNQSLVTTADRIRPLVVAGFHGTGMLPPDRGLLVALGGEPTILYVGREAEPEYIRKQGAQYFFRVVERVQFVPRDPRALILLKFEQPVAAAAAAKKP